MKVKPIRGFRIQQSTVPVLSALSIAVGCSSTALTPPATPQPPPPAYVGVPHPTGSDLADLHAILIHKNFPEPEILKDCDQDFQKLYKLSLSEGERKQGVRELVKRNPVYFHWCFYQKSYNVEEKVRSDAYIDDKQKTVLDTYTFLVPIARAYMSEFRDSRYLRWAVTQYRRLSERVFFRRLDLTPEQTSELVQISNPFGLWREPELSTSVLDKYNIQKREEPTTIGTLGSTPIQETQRAPAGIHSSPTSDAASPLAIDPLENVPPPPLDPTVIDNN